MSIVNSARSIEKEVQNVAETVSEVSNSLSSIMYANVQSTNTSTGALVMTGGLAVGKNLNVGGNINCSGTIQMSGGITMNNLTLSGTSQSTSTDSGALIVAGGVGIGRNLYVGDSIYAPSYTSQLYPVFSFDSDINTGMYNPSTYTVGFTCDGKNTFNVSDKSIYTTVPIQNISGSATVPTYTFTTDTNTGLSNPANNELNVICDGISVASFTPTTFKVTGSIEVNNLNITTGDLTISNGKLTVLNDDAQFNKNLIVGGTADIHGATTIEGVLFVNDNATINGTIDIASDCKIGGAINTSGEFNVDGKTHLYNSAIIDKQLAVSSSISCTGLTSYGYLSVTDGGVSCTGNLVVANGGISCITEGYGLKLKEGNANSRMGVSPLIFGTATILNTSVSSTNTRFFLTAQQIIGTPGFLSVANVNTNTSFDIISTSPTDNSYVAWLLIDKV